MSETKKYANKLIEDAQTRFFRLDLETIQHIVLFRLEGERIEGDIINEFFYESVRNFVYSYNQD